MTLRLILTRHAKSDWDDPDLDDHARILNARGREAATAVGKWLKENTYIPEEILCSDAARTRETCDRVTKEIGTAAVVRYVAGLYLASASAIKAELGTCGARTIMLIGHNPGIGTLAARLVRAAPKHAKFGQYPTAATTVIDFDAPSWAAIEQGDVVDFAVPRDLLGTDGND